MKTVVLIWIALITLPLLGLCVALMLAFPQFGAGMLLTIAACALMVFVDRRWPSPPGGEG